MEVKSLFNGFMDSLRRFPQRPALEINEEVFTYEQLGSKISALQQVIQENEKNQDPFIAIFAHRSLTAYTGILGVLASGKGYLSLNPKFPIERTRTMFLLSKSRFLIVGRECLDQLSSFLSGIADSITVLVPDVSEIKDVAGQFPKHHFLTSKDIRGGGSRVSPSKISGESFAYLVFTSGSTGVPKGVPITHKNIMAYLENVSGDYDESDRFSQAYDLTFDASVGDLFICWHRGACLVCIPEESTMAPAQLIKEKHLTRWDSVPSVIAFMLKLKILKPNTFPSLRRSVFGGEPLTDYFAQVWQKSAPNSVIENRYGPTEATVEIMQYRWSKESPALSVNGIVPIGWLFKGQRACIMNENEQIVPRGQAGELCINGSQLAGGYWNDPEKTREKFVRFHFSGDLIWYRTGDRVKQDENGCFYFLGRMDEQVKIRGYRVELQEIDSILRKASGYAEAVSIAWPIKNGMVEGIRAFISGAQNKSEAEIITHCRQFLPEYMVPRRIYFIEKMPINASGKIDRKKLAESLRE